MSDELDVDGSEFLEESGEAWPDEPEEFDPHSLGPEIPSAPDPPDPTAEDVEVPPDLARAFWAAVVFANVGLFGVSLGPMLVYFEGMADVGLAVFLIGVLSLVFSYRRYHGYVHRNDGENEESGRGEDGDEGDGDEGDGDHEDDPNDPDGTRGTDGLVDASGSESPTARGRDGREPDGGG